MRRGLVAHWSKEPKTPTASSTPADRCTAATAWSGMYHHKDSEPLNLDTVRGYIEHYHFASLWPARRDPSRAPGRQAGATDDFRVMRAKIEALLAEDF
jgi:hypothetical protein